jgi:ADP-heptose:LPS heptosyltransferase
MAIDLRGDVLSLLPMLFWKIPVRIGRVTRGGAFAVTHAVPDSGERMAHEIDRVKSVAIAVGATDIPAYPQLAVVEDAQQKAHHILREAGMLASKTILFCPFAQWEWKHWPLDKYESVCERLRSEGFSFVVSGGKADQKQADAFACRTGALNLAGKLDLATFAGLCSICHSFVGVDSGPATLLHPLAQKAWYFLAQVMHGGLAHCPTR